VLALHACDTATDEALALGVRSGAPVIMCVPCCHKTLHQQMAEVQRTRGGKGLLSARGSGSKGSEWSSAAEAGELLSPMLDHGIMRQRFVDLLTDTFRAQLLRIAGYRWVGVEARAVWVLGYMQKSLQQCSRLFSVVIFGV
jgi:hypothetical protein